MKMLNLLVYLVIVIRSSATTAEEIINLKSSGFSETEILELVENNMSYDSNDFIKLKESNFTTEFIIKLKKSSTLPNVKSEQSIRDKIENEAKLIVQVLIKSEGKHILPPVHFLRIILNMTPLS